MAIEFEFPAVLLVYGPRARVGGLGCFLEEGGRTFSRDCGVKGLHIFC